eukprot:1249505-Amorphochlora_amoeboformis.AAC.1
MDTTQNQEEISDNFRLRTWAIPASKCPDLSWALPGAVGHSKAKGRRLRTRQIKTPFPTRLL